MFLIRSIDAWIITALLAITYLFCFFSHRHWLAELAVHWRLHMAIAALILCLLFIALGLRPVSGANFVLFILFIWPVITAFAPAPLPFGEKKDELKILLFNINYGNKNFSSQGIDWILAQNADVVVLQETNGARAAELGPLQSHYPWSRIEVNVERDGFGTSIFSRLPVSDYRYIPTGERGNNYGDVHLTTPSGLSVHLYIIHTPPPVTQALALHRDKELALMGNVIAQDPAPYKLLTGDFNCTIYSPHYQALLKKAGLQHAQQGYRMRGTWPGFLPSVLRIGIDHMLASPAVTIEKREVGPTLGSDHTPVIFTLALH